MNRCIFLLALVLGVTGQQNVAVSRTVTTTTTSSSSSSSSVSASASGRASYSISESSFSSSLESATEKSVKALESSPKNLDVVLESIAEAILNEIITIATAIISGDDIDAEAISLEFGAAVNTSLFILVGIKGFESLDVESVVSQVETSTKKIIMGVDGSSEVNVVAEDLGNAVIGAIGDGIAEVTGATFTFKVTVSTSSSSSGGAASSGSTVVKSQSSSSASASSSSSSEKSQLLLLLEAGEIEQVVKNISAEVSSSTSFSILDFLITAASNETLTDSLVQVFVTIFADAKFEFEVFGDILIEVSEINTEFSSIIQQAIVSAAKQSQIDGLVLFISIAFKQQSSLSTLLLSSIEGAIATNGCTSSLGDVLVKSKDAVGSGSDFETTIASSANTSSCLTESLKGSMSININSQLESGDIDAVFETLSSSQVTQIIASSSFAISAGYKAQVSELLVKFFESETITIEKLSVMIVTFLSESTSSEASSILIDSISSTTDVTKLIATFKFILTGTDTENIDVLVSLIAGSVSADTCGLSDLIDKVLADSTASEGKTITAALVAGGAEACIPASEPTPEPTPAPTPVPEPTTTEPASEPTVESTPEPVAVVPEVESVPAPVEEPTAEPAVVVEPVPSPQVQLSPESVPTPVPASPAPETKECVDVTPPGGYSCSEQAKFGKCQRKWMEDGGFCAKSCGFCCDDVTPPGGYTCAQQKEFGKCKTSWMIDGKFCRTTCGNCGVSEPSPSPIPTPTVRSVIEKSPAPAPVPTPKGQGTCDCGCGCGCDAALTANITGTIVKDVITQVLKELLN